jgi:hypothetical protein
MSRPTCRWHNPDSHGLPPVDVEIQITQQNQRYPTIARTISVVIPSSEGLDASQVDVNLMSFGPNMAKPLSSQITDVDGDGDMDMTLYFDAKDAGISCSMKNASLKADMLDGMQIKGNDDLKDICNP